jgi:CheY-like chemotaxis protein
MADSKPILLVEDDRLDVMAVRRVLKESHVGNELVHAEDGEKALAHLRDGHHERPCVILLDLNMPKMNGFEFLEALRADNALKDIPVVMVTTSPDAKDIRRSLELGAVAYVIKSPTYERFREDMRVIENYVIQMQSPQGLKTEVS